MSAPLRASICATTLGLALACSACAKHGGDASLPPHEEAQAASAESVELPTQQMASLTVQPVEVRSFGTEVVATARVGLDEERSTPVVSSYSGKVVRLLKSVGDQVAAGDPLLELDSPDLAQVEADTLVAFSAWEKAKAAVTLAERGSELSDRSLQLARANAQRQQQLFEDKTVAQKDVEQAQRDLTQGEKDAEQAKNNTVNARNDLAAAASALDAAKHRLQIIGLSADEIDRLLREKVGSSRLTITSASAGTVLARKVSPGQFIRQDNTDPLFVIADLGSVWIVADVAECDLPTVRLGQRMRVSLNAFANEDFASTVAYVSPAVDPTTRKGQVRCVVPNPERRFKTDMYAIARISTGEQSQSASVPSTAVIRSGSRTFVWEPAGGNRFVRHEIHVGTISEGVVQVLEGLSAGDHVVTNGALYVDEASHG